MKSNLSKSHDAMLKFLETLIRNSDKFPSREMAVQEYYDKAKRLVAKAHAASGIHTLASSRTKAQKLCPQQRPHSIWRTR